MKKILLFSVFLIFGMSGVAQEFENTTIEILPESSISIHGDAKVTEFTCQFDLQYLQEPENVQFSAKSTITFENTALIIENRGFDCGSRSRNKDFHKMVKTKEYPEMELTLNEVRLQNDNYATASVTIFIAGEENDYEVPVEIVQDETPRFRGRFQINIRDFGLEPIKKLFGLIVVRDKIEIDFDLKVRYE